MQSQIMMDEHCKEIYFICLSPPPTVETPSTFHQQRKGHWEENDIPIVHVSL